MMNNVIVWVIMLPLLASLATLVWPRQGQWLTLLATLVTLIGSVLLLWQVYQTGPVSHYLGGWQPGLGIALRADAMSALLLLMCMLVVSVASVYATRYFSDPVKKARFWPLWLMLVVALNALLLSGDLFNLYVTLELLGLCAVGLTALGNTRAALQAAIRYLTIGLLGSLAFLAGVAFVYAEHGTLDLLTLSRQSGVNASTRVALVLMTAGLLIKSALFPLHFWLPSAHASAPAPVSAALSALVVKVAVYIILRLWLDVFDTALTPLSSLLLGISGSVAVIWGSWQALQAERLKLLAAYSTVAQIGYLFIFLSVILALPTAAQRDITFAALIVFALTHGLAKSALFLSAGVIQQHAGHDRINELDGTAKVLPLTTFIIALAGVALIGLPPSGSFLAKWHLLSSSIVSGQWWWLAVIASGSLLAGAYVFRVLGHAFSPGEGSRKIIAQDAEQIPALFLALIATLLMGFGSAWVWGFVQANSFFQ